MRANVDPRRGIARFQVSRLFYHPRVLAELAAEYADQATVTFEADERRIAVSVKALAPSDAEGLWRLAGELANEWLNRQARLLRSRRARSEAAVVVARAFSSALAAPQKAAR